jgi:fatty-acyl-CoA synthase
VIRRDDQAGSTLTEEAVREHCRASLAHFKIPRYVMFVDEFPMTVTGKIQKYKMRETAVQVLGLDTAAGIEHA